jgi:hypothetical protein
LRAKYNSINATESINDELLLKTKNNVNSEAETPPNFELLLKSKNNASSDAETIFLINETLHEPLIQIANKLLGRQNLNFEQLTPPEQKLWNLFENSDIYEFLTGEKDIIPEFRHNWITCSAKPKVTFDYQGFLDSWRAFNQQQIPQPTPALQRSISEPSPVHHNL